MGSLSLAGRKMAIDETQRAIVEDKTENQSTL